MSKFLIKLMDWLNKHNLYVNLTIVFGFIVILMMAFELMFLPDLSEPTSVKLDFIRNGFIIIQLLVVVLSHKHNKLERRRFQEYLNEQKEKLEKYYDNPF